MPCLRLDPPDRCVQRLERALRRMAHIDAEDIRARDEQPLDLLRLGRRRTERRDDLDASVAPHWVCAPVEVFSPESEIVQSVSSPVSTSKKPVFW